MVIAHFSGRSRLDACPGALQVHAAADGGLARVRVPGGRLTTSQLRELAGAASTYGSGVIELTSRANVQVRGLGEGGGFAARMAAAGLLPSATHERIRNVLASPLTGLDGGGITDVGPLISELDRHLCARPALAALPGRFMFALDDGRRDVAGLGADATILPTGPDEAAVVLAGVDGGLRVLLDAAVRALLTAAEEFLAELAAQQITAWRIGELEDGPARVAARIRARSGEYPPLPGHDPARAAGTAASAAPLRLRPVGLGPVGVVERPRASADRRVALGVAVPLGRLTSAQAELLAGLASCGELRLTPWRGMVLPRLDRKEVAGTAARLAEAGLVTDPASPWIGVTACTGRPGCAKSLADVRADATLAITSVRNEPADSGTLPVHWAGCERRCGRPRGRVADVVATGDGYRLDLDGRSLACADIEETAAAMTAARGEL
ncbi:precorrin-3B synthase [Streptosporangium lutulentum]|uniref:precorrin-3B synthase n=1 Tax=Streptosporangium lutulentum TaxID=1461250 RepID=UPI0036266D46